jgi:ribosome-associated protein
MATELDDRPPSRSAQKRSAQAIEDLARTLVELPDGAWRQLPLPADLRQELAHARGTREHGARRRQLKHLAGLLRKRPEETGEIQEYLAGVHQDQRDAAIAFHELEALRGKLCGPDFAPALEALKRDFPDLDLPTVSRLAAAVRERNDRRAYRELFRLLRQMAGTGI